MAARGVAGIAMGRAINGFTSIPRKRIIKLFVIATIGLVTLLLFNNSIRSVGRPSPKHLDSQPKFNSTVPVIGRLAPSLAREDRMEEGIAEMQTHLQFLDSLYRARQEDIMSMQNKIGVRGNGSTQPAISQFDAPMTIPPVVAILLKNYTGTRAVTGLQPKPIPLHRAAFVLQLLPHLMNNPYSLRPAYHLRSGRSLVDVVIGIPTVRRDKESYLLITLTHLINGMSEIESTSTLIVVFVGETDLEYIVYTARQIEAMFPKHVDSGLIEILAPAAVYYPDLDAVEESLGDSKKRVRWRTKQNLDAIYLMSYAQTKGTFYLMLEDDVIAKRNYMQDIKQFTAATTISTPQWFFLEFCQVGGIGKLFRSSDLIHFITYVQLFYKNMPIDWLLESYLADRVCTIDKTSKACGKSKIHIRPKYKTSLFQHIGLYSSLKGKIQRVRDSRFGSVPTFYPHVNPPVRVLRTDIVEQADHTLRRAYEGQTYFWGIKPKRGDLVEIWFEKPTTITGYIFRSGNVDHTSDKFYDTVVEVLPEDTHNYSMVGSFDEFGLADGVVPQGTGPLAAIRLRVNTDSFYWVILSEIELKTVVDTR